jgi:hypothetical protein
MTGAEAVPPSLTERWSGCVRAYVPPRNTTNIVSVDLRFFWLSMLDPCIVRATSRARSSVATGPSVPSLFGADSVPLQRSFPEGETYTVRAEPYPLFEKMARGSRRRIVRRVIFMTNLSMGILPTTLVFGTTPFEE